MELWTRLHDKLPWEEAIFNLTGLLLQKHDLQWTTTPLCNWLCPFAYSGSVLWLISTWECSGSLPGPQGAQAARATREDRPYSGLYGDYVLEGRKFKYLVFLIISSHTQINSLAYFLVLFFSMAYLFNGFCLIISFWLCTAMHCFS